MPRTYDPTKRDDYTRERDRDRQRAKRVRDSHGPHECYLCPQRFETVRSMAHHLTLVHWGGAR